MSYLILLSRKKLLPWTQGSVNTDSFMVCQGWQIGTVDVQPLVPKYVDMPTSLCTTVGRLVDSAFFWLFSWLVFFFKKLYFTPNIIISVFRDQCTPPRMLPPLRVLGSTMSRGSESLEQPGSQVACVVWESPEERCLRLGTACAAKPSTLLPFLPQRQLEWSPKE